MWGCWEGVRELVQNWHDGIYDTKALLEEQDRGRPDNRKITCEDYEVKFDKVGHVCFGLIIWLIE